MNIGNEHIENECIGIEFWRDSVVRQLPVQTNGTTDRRDRPIRSIRECERCFIVIYI